MHCTMHIWCIRALQSFAPDHFYYLLNMHFFVYSYPLNAIDAKRLCPTGDYGTVTIKHIYIIRIAYAMNMQICIAFVWCEHRHRQQQKQLPLFWRREPIKKTVDVCIADAVTQFGVNYILLFANHCVAGNSSAYTIPICIMSRSIGNWDEEVFIGHLHMRLNLCHRRFNMQRTPNSTVAYAFFVWPVLRTS